MVMIAVITIFNRVPSVVPELNKIIVQLIIFYVFECYFDPYSHEQKKNGSKNFCLQTI